MKTSCATWLRNIIFWFLIRKPFVKYGRLLYARAEYTEIGLSGHVSLMDKEFAKERKYAPLNKTEKWLMKPIIDSEKENRQKNWRRVIIEVTGEDPLSDWT